MTKPNRFFSKRQEDAVAGVIGGKRVPNSGATLFAKGDVSGDDILVECKTVTKDQKSITIKEEWIDKNKEEAFARGKTLSVLAVNFGPNKPNYFIVDEDTFADMYRAWKEERDQT